MHMPITKTLAFNGMVTFILTVTKLEEHCAEITVDQVTAWDEQDNPVEQEPYLGACINFDGGCHVNFGTPKQEGRDGYLYISGAHDWKAHCTAMEWIYKETTALIKHMDPDEDWDA